VPAKPRRGVQEAKTGRAGSSRERVAIGEDEAVDPSRSARPAPQAPLSYFMIGRVETGQDLPRAERVMVVGVGEASRRV